MIVYICMHCRKELYKEGEEEVLCEDHPWAPAAYVNVENDSLEEAPQ